MPAILTIQFIFCVSLETTTFFLLNSECLCAPQFLKLPYPLPSPIPHKLIIKCYTLSPSLCSPPDSPSLSLSL